MIVAEGSHMARTSLWASMLQWGRNLIVAEGLACRAVPKRTLPLQWGRNLIVAEGRRRAAFPPSRAASMGPQLDSCGRRGVPGGKMPLLMLQWGRNLIVAEGRRGFMPP